MRMTTLYPVEPPPLLVYTVSFGLGKMTIKHLSCMWATLLLLLPLAIAQGTISSCHPYPGAAAQDCLQLIGSNLRNSEIELPCQAGRATITQGQCSITTKCLPGQSQVDTEEVVRRALTVIGACAFNDLGSISGAYTTDSGEKTCYLYPGSETSCN